MPVTKKSRTSGMHIIHVSPLSKGMNKEHLSYFTSKKVTLGSIINVQIRKKEVPALVVSEEPALSLKAKIRGADFVMKKITDSKGRRVLLPSFCKAVQDTAHYFATTTGSMLYALTPRAIMGDLDAIREPPKQKESKDTEKTLRADICVFQDSDQERITAYKSIIRQSFANNTSVFLCLPTKEDVNTVAVSSLFKGIEAYALVFHSGLKPKEIQEKWNRAVTEKHPLLIVGTGSFLSIPRNDIKTIIVEKEHSPYYKTFVHPYFDIRTLAEKIAKRTHSKLIFGDSMLRPETLWKAEQGEYTELVPIKFRVLSTATSNIIDMVPERNALQKEKSFRVLSDEVSNLIIKTKKDSEHMYIFAARRGLASITVCNDCGDIVLCRTCKTPVVLHKKSTGNIFTCHRCRVAHKAVDACARCGGWRLVPLGTGIERIEETLAKDHADIAVFRIDSDTTTTPKQRKKVMEKFLATPGSVLLGTEMALSHLPQKIDNVAAVGIDSLLALPNFRAREHLFHIILTLRNQTRSKILIQTRNKKEVVFSQALKGNILDFYRNEIDARERFDYPPFSTIIKITCTGTRTVVKKMIAQIEKTLTPWGPRSYATAERPRGSAFAYNIMIKLPHKKWVDEELLSILRSLPLSCIVRIDPENVL